MTAALDVRAGRVGPREFDRKYLRDADPWDYLSSGYERAKYRHTLAALPQRRLGRVLEVGCSIGVFSAELADRCERLEAIDFSGAALKRARERLGSLPNVGLTRADFPLEVPEGEWDVIVCSEVLYYLSSRLFEQTLAWMRARLDGGACLLIVSWRGPGAEPLTGDEVHDRLEVELGEWHDLDGRQPDYRLDRFRSSARA